MSPISEQARASDGDGFLESGSRERHEEYRNGLLLLRLLLQFVQSAYLKDDDDEEGMRRAFPCRKK
jgi:hypothetical protein